MSDIEALTEEVKTRHLNMIVAWERLETMLDDAGPPVVDVLQPESLRERNLRKAAAAYADHANLFRAAQQAVRGQTARNAERHNPRKATA